MFVDCLLFDRYIAHCFGLGFSLEANSRRRMEASGIFGRGS